MNSGLARYIGPYAIERTVGTGGMGFVVLARHRLIGREVAIKLRHRSSQGSGELVLAERFRQGALLQADLDHPAIARVYDYLESPTLQALVLEYLPGGSVEDRINAEGALPIAEAVEIGVRAAEALAFAHGRGVIHRDIKPGNLMLREASAPASVRVTDFGVAKSLENSPDLTVAGANVGTLWYMSPEQFNSESPDPRVDVYALGATLYEMLTGQIPFERAETSELFRRFLDRIPPPPLVGRNPAVPVSVAAVVEAALALDVDARVPSAAALALLLRATAEREGFGVEGAAARRLRDSVEPEGLARVLATLSGPVGHSVAEALSSLDARLREPDVVETRVSHRLVGAGFARVGPEDRTPTQSAPLASTESVTTSLAQAVLGESVGGSLIVDGTLLSESGGLDAESESGAGFDDEDDEEDHTIIMARPRLDDD